MNEERALRPIGIFDSGLGGLTVLRALHHRLPCEDFVYFGDTARVPYGTKGEKTVLAFARQDAGLLVKLGVKMVVVACNTASAFALEHLAEVCPVPVIGVIEPGVEAALDETTQGKIGVIGTSGTIRSKRYQDGLQQSSLVKSVVARECPLLVPLMEEGMSGHPMTTMAVQQYLQPLRDEGVDTVILGCTHYPLLRDDIAAFMGPDVKLVDSADTLAAAAEKVLAEQQLLKRDYLVSKDDAGDVPAGQLRFYLSDIPWKFAEIGARFLGKPIAQVETVDLEEMEDAGAQLMRTQAE